MSDPEAPIDAGEGAAEGATSEPTTKSGRGFFRKLWVGVVLGLVLWIVGAGLVLWWQPSRIVQSGIIFVVVVAALIIPRRHIDRILSAFACLVVIGALFYLPSYLLTSEIEFTVRAADRDSEAHKYLIHTDYGAETADAPGEAFQNGDAPLLGKTNSSDIQGQAEALKGERVRARVYGIRVPDFSWYRNVIEIEAVE